MQARLHTARMHALTHTHTRAHVLQKDHPLAWLTSLTAAGGNAAQVMTMLCRSQGQSTLGDAMDVLVQQGEGVGAEVGLTAYVVSSLQCMPVYI